MGLEHRIGRLEDRDGGHRPVSVVVYRDDHGNVIAPQGEPDGVEVIEVRIGGLDFEADV